MVRTLRLTTLFGRVLCCALIWLALAVAASAQVTVTLANPVAVAEGDVGTTDAVFDITVVSGCGGLPCGFDFESFTISATAGVDFGAPTPTTANGVVDGDVLTVTVPVTGDTTPEGDETFGLRVCGGPVIPLGTCTPVVTTFTGTILEDDVTIAIDDVSVVEGDTGLTDAVFTVTASGPPAAEITFDYAAREGTATASDDFQIVVGAGAISVGGPLTQTITVPVIGDLDVEPDETFTVELLSSTGALITVGTGTGTILNDDSNPTDLSIDDVTIIEGDSGTTDATLTVTLDDALSEDVVLDFETADGTATTADSDYTATTGTLTIPPGSLSGTITIPVIGDETVEGNETFTVELTVTSPAALINVVDGTGEVTIENDDGTAISIDDTEVTEGDSGTLDAELTVRLSNPSSEVVTVDYATADGSARSAAGDYTNASGTVRFAAGETEATISIAVRGDLEVEGDEDFSVELSGANGGSVTDDEGTVTIVDDDFESTLTLIGPLSVDEAGGEIAVEIERGGDFSAAAQVRIDVAGATAQPGDDFASASAVLSWAAGRGGVRSFDLSILDDNLEEGDETFTVRLSNAVGATIVGPTTQTWTIVDDDVPMSLETVDGDEPQLQVGQINDLQVLVTREDGSPVAGTTITWTVEGPGELLDGDTSTTGEDGVAANSLRLGPQLGEVIVTATLGSTGTSVTFTFLIEGNLADLFDPVANPNERSVGGVLDRSCALAVGEFSELCRYLFELGEADRIAVVTSITPNEIAAQGNLALQGPRGMFGQVGRRLAALRGSATERAEEQIAFVIDEQPITVAALRMAFVQYMDEELWIQEKIAKALAGAAPAGAAPTDEDSSVYGDVPRLGFFASGRVTFGDRDPTDREEGWELSAEGLTAGLDYRLSDRSIFGAAIGYLKTDIDLDSDGGGADVEGYSLAVYGSRTIGAGYLDGTIGFGSNDYDLVRNIDLPVPFLGASRYTASGSPGSDQLFAGVEAGYATNVGATDFGGFLRASLVDASIDRYTESGAGPFNLSIESQDLTSILVEVGGEMTRAISVSWGVVQPLVRVSFLRELDDDARLVRGRFAADLQLGEFVIETDDPDRSFFNVGLGFNAVFRGGTSAFILYDTDLERDDLDLYTISAGLRLEIK